MSRRSRKKWGINKKILTGIIFLTMLISICSCVSGSLIFDKVIQKLYNDKGYVIANIILDDIDHDKIAEYAKTWEEDEYYVEMVEHLREIEQATAAAYIYIAVPYEDHTMRYIYDTGTYMGDTDPISASFDEIWTTYTQGTRPKSYLVRNSKKYGALTSSCLPVVDSNGDIVALLFVDTNMEVIWSSLNIYISNMVLISFALLTIFCVMNWYLIRRNIIDPILTIRKNVRNFSASSGSPDDSLKSIKTEDELQDLATTVDKMEQDILQYIDNIQSITAEKERIGAELNVATKIQADMLPRIFPPFPDRHEFDIYATMTPAKEVGGDFYDFFFVDDDHLALVMADVSGKGVPAALFMVIAKTLIKNRAIMTKDYSPADVLTDVNAQLCEGNDAELFVTVWMCIVELSSGKCVVANAGHEHPVIKRKGDRYELAVYKHSPPVATIENIVFKDHEFTLSPGDSIFVYTDGVAESSNADNELFGTDRMLASLNKEPEADAKTLLKNVKEDIDLFVGEAPQFDDITMLGFKYYGK
jgi:sigma-B regulation protein RsbU (phosphoserine phosphatase)